MSGQRPNILLAAKSNPTWNLDRPRRKTSHHQGRSHHQTIPRRRNTAWNMVGSTGPFVWVEMFGLDGGGDGEDIDGCYYHEICASRWTRYDWETIESWLWMYRLGLGKSTCGNRWEPRHFNRGNQRTIISRRNPSRSERVSRERTTKTHNTNYAFGSMASGSLPSSDSWTAIRENHAPPSEIPEFRWSGRYHLWEMAFALPRPRGWI